MYGPFLWMGFNCLKVTEPLQGGSTLFTIKLPDIPGAHWVDCGRMKGWVDPGATQWFWTRYPWLEIQHRYIYEWALNIYQELIDRRRWKNKQKRKVKLFLTEQCLSLRYKVSVLSIYVEGVAKRGSFLPAWII